jgi:hypothetical protein
VQRVVSDEACESCVLPAVRGGVVLCIVDLRSVDGGGLGWRPGCLTLGLALDVFTW